MIKHVLSLRPLHSQSYYVVGAGDDKTVVPALRRTQLAASLPSKQPSICSPTPNEIVSFQPSADLQCTTVRSTPRKKYVLLYFTSIFGIYVVYLEQVFAPKKTGLRNHCPNFSH